MLNTAKFLFVCAAAHDGAQRSREGPAITLVSRQWAYCVRGGLDGHDWREVDGGMTLEELQTKSVARALRR